MKSNHWEAPEDGPEILKEKRELTHSELAFIRAAASPAMKRTARGERFIDRWAGFCDIEKMADLLAQEPELLQSVGTHLVHATIAMRGCAEATRFLLEQDLPLLIDTKRYNVLHEATYLACSENLKVVFDSGAADATSVAVEKPHTGWPNKTSLMYWAVKAGNVECAKLLIIHGVGIHHELAIKGNGERGTTSLHEAVADDPVGKGVRKHEISRLLIEDGAYYDIYSACGRNDNNRLMELISDDAKMATVTDNYGMTPFHWAARSGAIPCAQILLDKGASVSTLNKARRSPLHMAADRNKVEMIRFLAEHGADLNIQDTMGRTPLHRATFDGLVDAAEALLSEGADPMIRNKKRKNAFEVARMEAKYFKERI